MGKCFAMSGFAVYCFDFCGGSILGMSIFTERDDLDAVIDHIRALDCVDPDNRDGKLELWAPPPMGPSPATPAA